MNIVITLPTELIDAILSRKKSIELRSKMPSNFDKSKDVVYVCQKGSQRVPLFFTVKRFVLYKRDVIANSFLYEHASVPVKWVFDYRDKHAVVYAWEISYVCLLAYSDEVWQHLNIKHNPQCFSYTNFEWRKETVLDCFAPHEIDYFDMEELMHPMKEIRDYKLNQKNAVQ